MDEMKAMTLRFSASDAELLEAIAEAEGRSVSSLLREAVALLIQQRRRSPTFEQSLRREVERKQQLLERLRDQGKPGGVR